MPPADAFDTVRRFPAPACQQEEPHNQRQQEAKRPNKNTQLRQKKAPTRPGEQQKSAEPARPRKRRKKQKKANPARRRRQRRFAALVGLVVLIAVGVWFSVTVLFKINKYEVQGEGIIYTEEEIISAFGHAVGDNLYGFSVSSAQKRLETSLPYLEVADIRRRPPSTVVFRLTMAQEAYYLPWDGAFVVLNAKGKVLRIANEAPDGPVRIEGLSSLVVELGHPVKLDEASVAAATEAEKIAASAVSAAAASSEVESVSAADVSSSVPEDSAATSGQEAAGENGSSLTSEAEPPPEPPPTKALANDPQTAAERFEVMWVLLETLEASGLEDINWLDVSDPLELRFGWQDRITVRLGPKSGMEEKLKALVVLLTDPNYRVNEGERGTFDLTLYLTTGECIFTPE